MAEQTSSSQATTAAMAEEEVKLSKKVKLERHDSSSSSSSSSSASSDEDEEATALDGDFIKVEREVPEITNQNDADELLKMLQKQLHEVSVLLSDSESKNKLLENQLSNQAAEIKTLQQELEARQEKYTESVDRLESKLRLSVEEAKTEVDKGLELGKLLELANIDAKQFEDQLVSLKGEFGELEDKTRKLEHDLEVERSKVQDTENILISSVAELKKELEQAKMAESEAKDLIKSTQENLEDLMLKLKQEAEAKEELEKCLKLQETKTKDVVEELEKVSKERHGLDDVVSDLTKATNELEAKLQRSDENFRNVDSLLSEAVAKSMELEQKLKDLEKDHNERGIAVLVANQKNSELEKLLQAANTVTEESETRRIVAEQRNAELEEKLNLEEVKSHGYHREFEELSKSVSELKGELESKDGEKQQVGTKLAEFQSKVEELETKLSESTARGFDLETEIKSWIEKCTEHEGRADAVHQRSIELENLVQSSDTKAVEADKRLADLELLLETEKQRIKELEENVSLLVKKNADVEEDSLQSSKRASKLEAELETVQVKAASLEAALRSSVEKENELNVSINAKTDENRKLKEECDIASEKLSEAETLLSSLRDELSASSQKLESIENDLRASVLKGSEATEKLKVAEDQLEQQTKALDKVTARSAELELSHDTLKRDSELKLQEALASFTTRDSEAKALHEKVVALEDQVSVYQVHLGETAERLEIANTQIDQILSKLQSTEVMNEDLKEKIAGIEKKSQLEKTVLSESNSELSSKVKELEEKLVATASEIEISTRDLSSHKDTIVELTELHSKTSQLHSEAEVRISELAAQLEEKTQYSSMKDSEAKALHEKVVALEDQVDAYQVQVAAITEKFETANMEFDQILSKLHSSEATNGELREKIAELEKRSELEKTVLSESNSELSSKVVELEEKLVATASEIEISTRDLSSHKDTIVELTELQSKTSQLHSEAEVRISELAALLEEKTQYSSMKDSEAKALHEKVAALEDQVDAYQVQVAAITEKFETANMELDQILSKLQSSEATNDELREKIAEVEKRRELEKTILSESNSELSSKVIELEEKLVATALEIEISTRDLSSHKDTIVELTELHSKMCQLHSEAEVRISELTAMLEEKTQYSSMKDSEAKALHEKVVALEDQVDAYQVQVAAITEKYKTVNMELDQILSKLQSSEATNGELREKIAEVEKRSELDKTILSERNSELSSQVIELEKKLVSTASEIEISTRDLSSHKDTIVELTELHTKTSQLHSEAEVRISELAALLEEKTQYSSMKDSEAKALHEKVAALEDQVDVYQVQVAAITEKFETANMELDQILSKLQSSEATCDELREKIAEVEKRSELEKTDLSENNSVLSSKVKELEEKLVAIALEIEISTRDLSSHKETIVELTELQSKTSQLHSEAEVRISELAAQLEEKTQYSSMKDSEAKALHEKVVALEDQVDAYQVQVAAITEKYETANMELDQILSKVQSSEATNGELREKIVEVEKRSELEKTVLSESNSELSSKVIELEEKLVATASEIEISTRDLSSHKDTIVELTELHTKTSQLHSEAEVRISELAALLEEKTQYSSIKDSEAKALHEKVAALEDQVDVYQVQVAAITEKFETANMELDQILSKLQSSEATCDELREKIIEVEKRSELEKTDLSENNSVLSSKVKELEEKLVAIALEIEISTKDLSSHKETIVELTELQSKTSQLHSEAEVRISELAAQLEEKTQYSSMKDSEAKALHEKVAALEDQVDAYQVQVATISEKYETTNMELDQILSKLQSSEATNDELREKIIEVEKRSELEKTDLSECNSVLSSKVKELEEKLVATSLEIEISTRDLSSHKETIVELTELHSKTSQLHSEAEVRISELAAQLEEKTQYSSMKDSEAKSLHEKVVALEDQVDAYQVQVAALTEKYETANMELDQILLKIQSSEATNGELREKIAEVEKRSELDKTILSESNSLLSSKVKELEEKLVATALEIEISTRDLSSHKDTIVELTELHSKTSHLRLEAESRISELAAQLEEKTQYSSVKVSEAKVLNDKVVVLEDQVNAYQVQLADTTKRLETATKEMDQVVLKLKSSEFMNEELKEKITDVEKSSESERTILSECNAQLIEKVKDLEEKLVSKDLEIETSTRELSSLKDAMNVQTKHYNDLSQLRWEGELHIFELEGQLKEKTEYSSMKDSEAKALHDKVVAFEDQISHYQVQLAEITEKLQSSEVVNRELKERIADVEKRSEMEKTVLFENNSELRSKVKELEEKLVDTASKIEISTRDLSSQKNTIIELTELHSKTSLLHTEAESRISELTAQLEEKTQYSCIKDSEAKDLHDKVVALEDKVVDLEAQVDAYQLKLAETTEKFEAANMELDQILLKLQSSEVMNGELNGKIAKAELEKTILTESNLELSNKVKELEENIVAKDSEIETSTKDLSSHKDTIIELTEHRSRISQLHSEAEVRILELLMQLEERTQYSSMKDSEAKALHDKVVALEDQVNIYQVQLAETTEKFETASNELDQILSKLRSSEITIEEFKEKIAEVEKGAELEKAALSEFNAQLSGKVKELEEKLVTTASEIEISTRDLSSHKSTIVELTELHSKTSQLHSEAQARISELATQLEERTQYSSMKDSEAKALHDKVVALEDQVNIYQVQLAETTEKFETASNELDQILSKLRSSEITIEEFKEKIAEVEKGAELEKAALSEFNAQLSGKVKELEEKLVTTASEIEISTRDLSSHKSTIVELTELHSKTSQLHSEAQARISELATQLEERTQYSSMKDSEAKALHDKVVALEDQVNIYQVQLAETTEKFETASNELDQILSKLRSSEITIEEFKEKIAEVEKGAELEKAALSEFNAQLSGKVKELEEKLVTTASEIEISTRDLSSHKSTIVELTELHSKTSQLHSEAQARISELATQLEERTQYSSMKDSEVKVLLENAVALEDQVKIYQIQLSEIADKFETANKELDHILSRLQSSEAVNEELKSKISEAEKRDENHSLEKTVLSESISQLSNKVKNLEETLAAKATEIEISTRDLFSHKSTITELTELHSKTSELHSAAENRISELEAQLEEIKQQYSLMDSDAQILHDQVMALEDQVKIYQVQLAETTEKFETAHKDLDSISVRLQSSEAVNEELKEKITEAQRRGEFYALEKTVLFEHNTKLGDKVKELEENLAAKASEIEISARDLFSHKSTITELTQLHSKTSELHSAAENRISELEAQLEEIKQQYSLKDSDAKILHDQVMALEDQVKIYEVQLAETTEKFEIANKDLDSILLRLHSSEAVNAEIKEKTIEYERRCESYASEKSFLSENNTNLREKVKDLEEKLAARASEIEISTRDLFSHKSTITELTELHSKTSELHSAAENRISELEAQLEEIKQQYSLKDSDAKILHDQVMALEDQVKIHQVQLAETTEKFETAHKDLDSISVRLQSSEAVNEELKEKITEAQRRGESYASEKTVLFEHNTKLGDKVKELEEKLAAKASEIEISTRDLFSHKSTITELTQLHSKTSELHSAAENRISELEAQLEEIKQQYSLKDSDAKILHDQVMALEDQVKIYEVQLAETTEKFETANKDLDSILLRLQSSEAVNAELKGKTIEYERRCEYYASEKTFISENNTNLREKVKDLEEKLAAKASEIEISTREFDSQLQGALASFASKDSESKVLKDQVVALEDQVNIFQLQLAETTEKFENANKELDHMLSRLQSSEVMIEELKEKIIEAEHRGESHALEKTVLSENNAQLSSRVKDLEEKLVTAASEFEISTRDLSSHKNSISELTELHAMTSKLHSAAESRVSELEKLLEEVTQRSSLKDSEAKELQDKLTAVEELIKNYEEKEKESSVQLKSGKAELEQALSEIKDLKSEHETSSSQIRKEIEELLEENQKISQDLASCKTELSDLQVKLSQISSEKSGTEEELNIARKEIEEITTRLASESLKLQSQITSVLEEKNLLAETCQSSKKYLESVITDLEEKVKEHKSNEDSLKTKLKIINNEVYEKSELEKKLQEFEELLSIAESKLKEERELRSQNQLEHEAALKKSVEKIKAMKNEILTLSKHSKDLELKLQHAEPHKKEKDSGISSNGNKDETIKSREIDLSIPSTTSKRKGKKMTESVSSEAVASSHKDISTTEFHPSISFQFVLGVALMSIVIGIILGKRY